MKNAIPLRFGLAFILAATLIPSVLPNVFAQNETDALVRVDRLRLDLIEIQTKEAEVQARVQQLDEEIKPENIERSLAGVGSTRPEELREQRRRQLQIEKDSLTSQLTQLEKIRSNLETAIVSAETEAYQQSARESKPYGLEGIFGAQFAAIPLWLLATLAALVTIFGLTLLFLLIRRMRDREVGAEPQTIPEESVSRSK